MCRFAHLQCRLCWQHHMPGGGIMTTTVSSTAADVTADLLGRVEQLRPLIEEHVASAEANRKMAPDVMAAIVDAGLLRMWIPRALGGLEVAPNTALAVMEALARIDPSTGWVVSNCVFITT